MSDGSSGLIASERRRCLPEAKRKGKKEAVYSYRRRRRLCYRKGRSTLITNNPGIEKYKGRY